MFHFPSTYVPRWEIITIELTFKCYCNQDKLTHIRPYCPSVKLPSHAWMLGGREYGGRFCAKGIVQLLSCPSHPVCVHLQFAPASDRWPTVTSQSWEVLKNSVNPRSTGTCHDVTDVRYHKHSVNGILRFPALCWRQLLEWEDEIGR